MTRKAKLVTVVLFVLAVAAIAETASRMVVITPTGKKYHLAGCSTLSRSKSLSTVTIEEAKSMGLQACKVCRPGD